MKELKLLIVEDDQEQLDLYDRDVKSFNLGKEIQIIITAIKEKELALKALIHLDFDAAIVDLDLKNTGGQDSSGNEILKEIKNNLRFPVYVVTGTPQNVDDGLKVESAFFKIKTRGDVEEVSYWEQFINIYNTGITQILNRKGTIEKYLSNIFWNHIADSIDLWITDQTRTSEQKEKTLLRYTLLHIQEYLEQNSDNTFDNYHPAETYIIPSVKQFVFTGDLVEEKKSGYCYIVLTPSCDLAQKKAKDILLAIIEVNIKGIMAEMKNIIIKNKAPAERIQEAENVIKNLIHNSFSNKYHFLPKYKSIKGGLVNFQKVKSVRIEELNSEFTIIASLNSQFTKDIVARFSYYYSRQGSPDFDSNEMYLSLIKD
ncbi:MAG: response regulator [Bacteroidales bacterium]|nr:response regulator [Bacteroidales bacterium]